MLLAVWISGLLFQKFELEGEICVHGLEHVKTKDQAVKAALNKSDKVTKFTLTWSKYREGTIEGNSDEVVMNGLQSHPEISSLEFLRSMLEELEQFPNLEFLGVHGFKNEHQLGEYFPNITPFLHLQSLKELLLVGCPEIRSLPDNLDYSDYIPGDRAVCRLATSLLLNHWSS